MDKNFKVKCPHCDLVFLYYDSSSRPFCSERCKMVDLGHWLKESYKVPLPDKINEEEDRQNENEDPNESFDEEEY